MSHAIHLASLETTSAMPAASAILLALAMLAAAGSAWSCAGPQRLRAPDQPGQLLVVLLPDADTGTVGRATVSTPAGSADLSAALDATTVLANGRPSPVKTMNDAEVKRIFSTALAALPLPPLHFTLFFRFDSDELTDEGRARIPEVLQAVKGRPSPDVAVVGHTDTMGPPAVNFELGMKRAVAVRRLLIAAGLDASVIGLASHGEGELLVQTANEVPEPRNRRVEISVQ